MIPNRREDAGHVPVFASVPVSRLGRRALAARGTGSAGSAGAAPAAEHWSKWFAVCGSSSPCH